MTKLLLLTTLLALPGCLQPECTSPNYRRAECRVVAENEVARLFMPSGIEVRFQDPDANTDVTWDATGLLEAVDDDTIRARVAGLGRFALSIRGPEDATLEVLLDNVSAEADVRVEALGDVVQVPVEPDRGLRRELSVEIDPTEASWIRGETQCPSRYRLAVTADIQTNPDQFERILAQLAEEIEDGIVSDEPLMGLVILGDISESSREDEFEHMAAVLQSAPLPVAVTAGNHDIYRPFQPHFNRFFGPGNHAFTICTTRVVLLDSGSGAIARSVEARLPELLDRGGAQHLLLGMHHPPYAGLTAGGWSSEKASARLLAEAAIADVDLVMAGHVHALHDFANIPVGDRVLREIIVGTGGAFQGIGVPRFGYMRLTIDADEVDPCFVEVPPPGFAGPQSEELSPRMPYCD